MKELISVFVADDGDISVTSDYVFPDAGKGQIDRESPLYKSLVEHLRLCGPDIGHAIRMVDSARRDARFDYRKLHPGLERELAVWRRSKAQEKGVPAFRILHQSVMLAIADLVPTTEDALLAIPGFGPGLFARYGEEILAITRAYSGE